MSSIVCKLVCHWLQFNILEERLEDIGLCASVHLESDHLGMIAKLDIFISLLTAFVFILNSDAVNIEA